jgi:hypothetical protein
VVLSFDDPASAARYVLPLLELYRMPSVVTVGAAEAADPATEPALQALGSSPWIELAARVDAEPQPADATSLRCGPQAGAAGSDEAASPASVPLSPTRSPVCER